MKVISFVVFVLLFCPVNDIVGSEVIPDSSIGPTLYLANSDIKCANENHEIIFYTYTEADLFDEQYQYFYLKTGEDPINITKKVTKQLLKLGMYPYTYLAYKSPSVYVEKRSYGFTVFRNGFDNSGNLLVKFIHVVGKEKTQLKKLGVWNKKYGFKIIEFPENMDDVDVEGFSPTNCDYLFLRGVFIEDDVKVWKAIIISLENGFWGEFKK